LTRWFLNRDGLRQRDPLALRDGVEQVAHRCVSAPTPFALLTACST
jgi:hypothetical protein